MMALLPKFFNAQNVKMVQEVLQQQKTWRRLFCSVQTTDSLLVIGSGVAGCAAGLIAAESGVPVTLVCAGSELVDCNSYWAQGGIIYRNYNDKLQTKDSADLLMKDIIAAGAGLNDCESVSKVAREGPRRVRQLLLSGEPFASVDFTRNNALGSGEVDEKYYQHLDLCLEASHSAPRILYKGDHSGKAITEAITAAAARHPLINVMAENIVTDLIISNSFEMEGVCIGVKILGYDGEKTVLANRGTVLASGGLCGIYEHSTNPTGFNAIGSSIALAKRANAKLADLEYVQFHPTALQIPNEARFLLTEALRGEGAKLLNSKGEYFASIFDKRGELAPRDIVARGVYNESQRSGQVYLDITHRDADFLKQRFPSINHHLKARNLDITKDPLPIIPAAHYTCGGVVTDSNGLTSINNLYAAGEAARTGLHGGNRLASTSLLEGLVYGAAVGEYVAKQEDDYIMFVKDLIENYKKIQRIADPIVQSSCSSSSVSLDDQKSHAGYARENSSPEQAQRHNKIARWLMDRTKKIMWDDVGIVRTPSGTQSAIGKLKIIKDEAEELFRETPTYQTAMLRDAAYAALEVAKAANANRISAGAHFILVEDGLGSVNEEEKLELYMSA